MTGRVVYRFENASGRGAYCVDAATGCISDNRCDCRKRWQVPPKQDGLDGWRFDPSRHYFGCASAEDFDEFWFCPHTQKRLRENGCEMKAFLVPRVGDIVEGNTQLVFPRNDAIHLDGVVGRVEA